MKTSLLFCMGILFSPGVRGQVADFAHADFTRADSIAELYAGYSLKNLQSLADKLTKPLSTEEEKFSAIYKWVCNNIEYDNALYLQHKNKRGKFKSTQELTEWNKKFSAHVFKTLLEKHRTVCTGYAYLVRELSSHAGLRCRIVDGYGRTSQSNIRGSGNANHSWNAIQLNHTWYLCDATWSSGSVDADGNYIKKYDDSYFLADPGLFVRNHYPLDSTWMLLDCKQTLKEFLNGPLIYSSAFRYNIEQVFPSTFDIKTAKGKAISFTFTTKNNTIIEKAELYIKRSVITSFVSPEIYSDPVRSMDQATKLYRMDYTFTAKGTHVVHILLNNSYAFTYTVKVE